MRGVPAMREQPSARSHAEPRAALARGEGEHGEHGEERDVRAKRARRHLVVRNGLRKPRSRQAASRCRSPTLCASARVSVAVPCFRSRATHPRRPRHPHRLALFGHKDVGTTMLLNTYPRTAPWVDCPSARGVRHGSAATTIGAPDGLTSSGPAAPGGKKRGPTTGGKAEGRIKRDPSRGPARPGAPWASEAWIAGGGGSRTAG